MLNFYYPELKDRDWVQPILSASGGLGSEHAFGTMYVWRWTYCRQICRYKDFLLSGFGRICGLTLFPRERVICAKRWKC